MSLKLKTTRITSFPSWDAGAPLPHVFSSGNTTHLVYVIAEPDPAWDGTYVNILSPDDSLPLAIVSFDRCLIFKFGAPNDEVFHGIPGWGSAFQGYEGYEILNSPWLDELIQINSVHERFDRRHWTNYHHYILFFHDELFECITQSFSVRTVRDSIRNTMKSLIE